MVESSSQFPNVVYIFVQLSLYDFFILHTNSNMSYNVEHLNEILILFSISLRTCLKKSTVLVFQGRLCQRFDMSYLTRDCLQVIRKFYYIRLNKA